MQIVQKTKNASYGFPQMMPHTVKAREHHGADSLDLTIPTEIVREYDLSAGDVLEVSIEEGQEELKICYEVVHKTQSD